MNIYSHLKDALVVMKKSLLSVALAIRQCKRLKQETPLLALRDSHSKRMKE